MLLTQKLKEYFLNFLSPMTSCTPSTNHNSKRSLTSVLKTTSQSTSQIIFDLETNALKPTDVTVIHCVAANDGKETVLYKDPKEWLPLLEEADTIIGHNIIQYDIACIKELYPNFKPKGKVIDTLILSRMVWPDILDIDFKKKWVWTTQLRGLWSSIESA